MSELFEILGETNKTPKIVKIEERYSEKTENADGESRFCGSTTEIKRDLNEALRSIILETEIFNRYKLKTE